MSEYLDASDDMQAETFVVERTEAKHTHRFQWMSDENGTRKRCICGRDRNEAAARRGKQSRNYGNRAELSAARKYGGDKIGAAGGPVDIRGKDFATQMKTHRRTVPSEWRKVFAAMAQENRIPRLLLRFVQGPGVAPADFFVFQADDFLDWFGKDENMVEGDPYTVALAAKTKP